MRGTDRRSGEIFSYIDLEKRVRSDHPLRSIRSVVDEALNALSQDFAALYSGMGRRSIAPKMLLRAMLLQAFYSVRSERQLMDRLEFDLLFRWFVGLGVDEPVWDHSTFSKNRDRLLAGEIAAKFLAAILERPRVRRLLSSDHFSVDGTLIEAWASMKSFRPRDDEGSGSGGGGRNAPADFRGEKRSNDSHASSTDPDAMLYKKGPGIEARLCFIGHGLMENRSGLLVDARLTRVSGHAERLAALEMIEPFAERPRAITLGADRGYDAAEFVEELRTLNVRPHVAQNVSKRRSAIDRRTTRHASYAASIRTRKRIEEAFGWIKCIAGFRKKQAPRPRQGRRGLHLRGGRLQPYPLAQTSWRTGMSVGGKWRIIAMPDFPADYPDMVEPAYILFEHNGGGEFAFGCCTGHIWEASSTEGANIDFSWDGSDEMDEVSGDGSAELQPDGSIHGEICYRHGDEYPFIAKNGLLQQPARRHS